MASLYRETPFDELTLEDWDTQMAVDLRLRGCVRRRQPPTCVRGRRRPHREFFRLGSA
jgi:hypothetical protein